MKPQDDLFQLIHSLSKSEKRYFRLYADMHIGREDRHYLHIFNAILKQDVYDQEAVIRSLKDHAATRRFSAGKNYLNHLILKSMRAYNAERIQRRRLRGMLEDVEFLYGKALYEQSEKLLRKAKKAAVQIEEFPAWLELLGWERKLLKRFGTRNWKKRLDEIIQEKEQVLERMIESLRAHDLYDEIFLLTGSRYHLRQEALLEEVRGQFGDHFAEEDAFSNTFQGRHLYLQARAMYEQLQGNVAEQFDWYRESLNWWEAHPAQIAESPFKYKGILANVIHAAALAERYEIMPAALKKLKSLPRQSAHGELVTRQTLYYYQLIVYSSAGRFDLVHRLRTELVEWLQKHGDALGQGRLIAFYFNLCLVHFLSAEPRTALNWLHKILDLEMGEARKDIRSFVRVLLIILHYDLGNDDVLSSMWRSAYRYLYKRETLHAFESVLLKYLRRISTLPPAPELKSILESLRSELKDMADGKNFIGVRELLYWVDAQLSGQSILQALQEDGEYLSRIAEELAISLELRK